MTFEKALQEVAKINQQRKVDGPYHQAVQCQSCDGWYVIAPGPDGTPCPTCVAESLESKKTTS